MSFLRSVIADARPRKPTLEPSENPSATTGWNTRGLDGDVSGAEEKSPGTADKKSRSSTSLPIREGASDSNARDAPAFQADDPVNQGIQDMASNVEPESSLPVPLDKSGPISDEESSTRLDTGNHPDRESGSEGDKASKAEESVTPPPAVTVIPDSGMNSPNGQDNDSSVASPETHGAKDRASGHDETEPLSSPVSIRDTPGRELTDNDGNSALQAEESAGQLGLHETTSSAVEGNTPAQGEVAAATAADDRHHSESASEGPVSGQAATPDNAAGRNEAGKAVAASGKARRASPSVEKQADMKSLSNLAEPPRHQEPDVAGATARDDRHHSESASEGPVSGQAATPDNSSRRNEAGKAVAGSGKARQVSPSVEKQTDKKSLSNQEDSPRLQKPDVAGATAADDRHHSESSTKGPVSGQAATPDNSAGRNEAGKAVAGGGKARQVSPSVEKKTDKKSLSNQEDSPRLQKPDAAKVGLRNVQLVSRQPMAVDSHISSDMELASVPQPAGTKAPNSASSPGTGSSKPSSPVQHIARSASPSAGPETLRSVPARPFLTDLMPKHGDSFHSRAPLRPPENTHEAPKVQIGQIDVIIEAAAQPVTKTAPAPSPVNLASRYYLRRL